jgi:methyltransferase (TIGR00027 family)
VAESVIANLSDTARWVAEYRAQESARPDPLFTDPLAAGLSGERGPVIAAEARRVFGNGWFFIARTKLMDDLIAACLREGCDRVVNLAAGFDTRPYRLDLPAGLPWIELDLPALVEEKDQALAGEQPRCRLTRRPVDLTDGAARQAALADAVQDAQHTLVITEGLLLYLDEPDVAALCAELRRPEVAWWVADVIGPAIVAMSTKAKLRGRLENAPLTFGPVAGVGYFERLGWAVDSVQTQVKAAARWRRLPALLRLAALLPDPDPRQPPGRIPWGAVMRLHPATQPVPAAVPGPPQPDAAV